MAWAFARTDHGSFEPVAAATPAAASAPPVITIERAMPIALVFIENSPSCSGMQRPCGCLAGCSLMLERLVAASVTVLYSTVYEHGVPCGTTQET